MLLTITTEHRPATDLGFLLHKNPARCQEAELAFGRAHLFYPQAGEERCTFALLLDLDPVALVRGKDGPESGLFDQYVNDRPYAASSFLSVAMAAALRTALNGRCDLRPELAQQAIPLEATVTPLPVRGDVNLVQRLFGPLGYETETTPIPLDAAWPEWGASPYVTLRLKARCRLVDLLNHLYVLIPVLDLQKHYFIGQDEIEKLLARGEGWLSAHPEPRADRAPLFAPEALACNGSDHPACRSRCSPRRGRGGGRRSRGRRGAGIAEGRGGGTA